MQESVIIVHSSSLFAWLCIQAQARLWRFFCPSSQPCTSKAISSSSTLNTQVLTHQLMAVQLCPAHSRLCPKQKLASSPRKASRHLEGQQKGILIQQKAGSKQRKATQPPLRKAAQRQQRGLVLLFWLLHESLLHRRHAVCCF